MIKRCDNCGKVIPKKQTVSNARYSQRKYCSQACYREWMHDNQEGWWKGAELKYKTFDDPDDQNAVEASKEFNYI